MNEIDISGVANAKVLAALYNGAKAQGLGVLHSGPDIMTEEQAEKLLSKQDYFDYLHGRVLKLDFGDDCRLDPRLYDRDNGDGRALQVLKQAGLAVRVSDT